MKFRPNSLGFQTLCRNKVLNISGSKDLCNDNFEHDPFLDGLEIGFAVAGCLGHILNRIILSGERLSTASFVYFKFLSVIQLIYCVVFIPLRRFISRSPSLSYTTLKLEENYIPYLDYVFTSLTLLIIFVILAREVRAIRRVKTLYPNDSGPCTSYLICFFLSFVSPFLGLPIFFKTTLRETPCPTIVGCAKFAYTLYCHDSDQSCYFAIPPDSLTHDQTYLRIAETLTHVFCYVNFWVFFVFVLLFLHIFVCLKSSHWSNSEWISKQKRFFCNMLVLISGLIGFPAAMEAASRSSSFFSKEREVLRLGANAYFFYFALIFSGSYRSEFWHRLKTIAQKIRGSPIDSRRIGRLSLENVEFDMVLEEQELAEEARELEPDSPKVLCWRSCQEKNKAVAKNEHEKVEFELYSNSTA